MPKRRRERSRSKTPEIPWELLLADPAPAAMPVAVAPLASSKQQKALVPARAMIPARQQLQVPAPAEVSGDSARRAASREVAAAAAASAASPLGAAAAALSASRGTVVGASAASALGASAAVGAGSCVDPISEISTEQAMKMEADEWRRLVGMLFALRGDPYVEGLLRERHPELQRTASLCGAGSKSSPPITLDKAREAAREWFARGLRGSNRHGAAERAKLCAEFTRTLRSHAAKLASTFGGSSEGPQRRLEQLLEPGYGRGSSRQREQMEQEEGPAICSLLLKELEGSRYENLWISRQGPGRYILGDDNEGSGLPLVDQDGARIHPRVRVVVKVLNGKLLIDGFYHEGEEDFLNPARVPIGPFLTVYFEGMPLKEALARWKNGVPKPLASTNTSAGSSLGSNSANNLVGGGSKPPGAVNSGIIEPPAAPRYQEPGPPPPPALPSGWEMRESRSKKGVFYYAHPAKGLSQMERPKP